MPKTLLSIILILLLLPMALAFPPAHREPFVVYTYDSNGNITSRYLTLHTTLSATSDTSGIAVDSSIVFYPNPTLGPVTAKAMNL